MIRTARGAFAAFEAGAPGAATALLIPGFTGSKEDFLAIIGPLAASGFHVVAYDQRGQFQTPGPAAAEGWTIDGFAADAVALAQVTGAGGKVHLLGHSFGGLVARAAVLRDPGTFSSLVLLDTGPAALPSGQAVLLRTFADATDSFDIGTVWELKRAYDLESGWQPPPDPAIEVFLRSKFVASDPGCLGAMARILASEPDRTDQLARLTLNGLRTLVGYGEGDDAWSPSIQVETASRLGAATVSFPEAAHSPAVESPAETVQALAAFWAGTEDAG